mmetsp:Transcript_42852/g.101734  ORF Transcript_42852/g.101734 Transcript_42852/m.101734 type:complete len:206 (+) Transcript_42852:625-1242(+)
MAAGLPLPAGREEHDRVLRPPLHRALCADVPQREDAPFGLRAAALPAGLLHRKDGPSAEPRGPGGPHGGRADPPRDSDWPGEVRDDDAGRERPVAVQRVEAPHGRRAHRVPGLVGGRALRLQHRAGQRRRRRGFPLAARQARALDGRRWGRAGTHQRPRDRAPCEPARGREAEARGQGQRPPGPRQLPRHPAGLHGRLEGHRSWG